jgi:hypothetical protein
MASGLFFKLYMSRYFPNSWLRLGIYEFCLSASPVVFLLHGGAARQHLPDQTASFSSMMPLWVVSRCGTMTKDKPLFAGGGADADDGIIIDKDFLFHGGSI